MSGLDWKQFKWQKLDFEDFETEEGETRYYLIDAETKFPSMTSMLSQLDDGGIDEWKKRVGEEEAERIVKEAVARGNSLHDLSERYLKNELQRKDVTGKGAVLFNRTRPILNEISLVVGIEVALYSRLLKYAGRVDCIGFHEENFCIIDHKNSRRAIDLSKGYARKKLFGYMLQTVGYAVAFHEMFPHLPKPTHGLLIVGNFDQMTSSKFKFELEPLMKEFYLLVNSYYNRADIKDSMFFKL